MTKHPIDYTNAARSVFYDILAELTPYANDPMQKVHDKYSMDMRCPDLFTDRAGCEDDDWPEFTEFDYVVEVADRCAGAKGFTAMVTDSEKCWLRIELTVSE